MTMMPNINTLTEIDLAVDADTARWLETPHAEVASIPVWGFASCAEAEMRLLRANMDDCFHAVNELLKRQDLTPFNEGVCRD